MSMSTPPPHSRFHRSSLSFASLALAVACTSHPLVEVPPAPEIETRQAIEIGAELDVLFLVDNSLSMEDEQVSLGRNFPLFMQEIEKVGPIDLRVAVITSDMGAGMGPFCSVGGDRGLFRADPACGLSADGPPFIRRGADGSTNFSGSLTDTFSCLARVGTEGCGFEHQLQAMRYALSASNPHAAAFLRRDAYLAVILISDEDDCSAGFDTTLFSGERAGEEPNLRCAIAGHRCNGQPVTAGPLSAPLESCLPAEPAANADPRENLIALSEFVEHLQALKPGRPDRLIVSGIIGWTADAQYQIRQEQDDNGQDVWAVAPACASPTRPNQGAAPAVRLKAFMDAFPGSSVHSICQDDLRQALQGIGERIKIKLFCLTKRPRDTDLETPGVQPECTVTDQAAGPDGKSVLLPACSGSNAPCWRVLEDRAVCGTAGYRIDITEDPAVSRPPGTVRQVACQSCVDETSPGCDY